MSIHVDDLRESCGLLGELAANEIEALEAENQKLREALREVADERDICDARAIARAALSKEPK